MHIFEFIIFVMIIVGVFEFLNQRKKRNASDSQSNKQQHTLSNEITELKQRVAVLEKIITDKGYDLKSQIDDL